MTPGLDLGQRNAKLETVLTRTEFATEVAQVPVGSSLPRPNLREPHLLPRCQMTKPCADEPDSF